MEAGDCLFFVEDQELVWKHSKVDYLKLKEIDEASAEDSVSIQVCLAVG